MSLLKAKCLVIRRKLQRAFAEKPAVMHEGCRWTELGVNRVCIALAKRYKVRISEVVAFCHPGSRYTDERYLYRK